MFLIETVETATTSLTRSSSALKEINIPSSARHPWWRCTEADESLRQP